MINPKWTKEELDILRESYHKKDLNELSKILKRSKNAIRIRACFLGIKKLDYRKNIKLSEEEQQIILGGLLGDFYCEINNTCKNARIQGAHCKEQKPYLLWKIKSLKSLSFSLRTNKKECISFGSKVYPCLNCYHDLFYKNGKKQVNYEILNKVSNFVLAIWYQDDGSYGKRGQNCRIYTNSFTYEENLIIKNWFENKIGIHPKIIINRDQKRYPGRAWYYLEFNVEDTKRLISIIKDYIHPSMKYKIGEENEIKSENEGGDLKWQTDQLKNLDLEI